MALINCPDCGHKISDKAEKCINCGRVMLQKEDIKCNECGGILNGTEEICPHCGFTLQTKYEVEKEVVKKQNNKKVLPIVGVVVLLAVIVILVMGTRTRTSSNLNPQGYFEDFIWGNSVSEVKEIASELGAVANNDGQLVCVIEDYKDVSGLDGMLVFAFENGGLNQIAMSFTTNDDCKYTINQLKTEGTNILDKTYGQFKEDSGFTYWVTEKSVIATTGVTDNSLTFIYDADTDAFK